MARVFSSKAQAAPSPGHLEHDDNFTLPVYVPACREECGPQYPPPSFHQPKTHARDTIHVPAGVARTHVKLDAGDGFGEPMPTPMECLILEFRRKGERCFVFRTDSLSVDWNSGLVIMWPREWERMEPGLYEARLTYNPDRPTQKHGGWLLFDKMEETEMRVRQVEHVARSPLGELTRTCAPLPDISGDPTPITASCGGDTCDDC